MMARNSFPRFSDGNVEIRFSESDEDKFVVHSWQLSLHSPWFKASLSERWRNGESNSIIEGKHYWIYELRFDKDTDLGMFVRKEASPQDSVFLASSAPDIMHPHNALYNRRAAIVAAHKKLIGCLYHDPPTFTNSLFMSDVKAEILQLHKVADIYGCQPIANVHIENHLQRCRDMIYVFCEIDPVSMIEFATKMKSDWIFIEAGIHLLGRSNRFYHASVPRLRNLAIEEIFVTARERFVRELQRYELKLFRIQRPAENWLGQVALNFFRQWLTKQLQAGKGSSLGPGYANLYHTIKKGTFSFNIPAQKQQVRTWVNMLFDDFSEEQLRKLEPELNSVFTTAAGLIEDILRNESHGRDDEHDDFRALTFTVISSDELPWEEEL